MEYPEVRKFATERASVVLRPKKTFKQVIDEHGYPFPSKEQARYVDDIRRGTDKMRQLRLEGRDGKFKLSKKWMKLVDAPFGCNDYCCTVMKKAPFKAYEKQTGRKPMLATMASESRLRFNSYVKNGGCNAFNNKRPTSTPMGFWTDDDVYQYIYENDLEIPSVYGEVIRSGGGGWTSTGVHRTGCVFCMFGVDQEPYPNRFQQLEKTHPRLHDYCINQLNLKQVLDYCDIPYTSKQEIA